MPLINRTFSDIITFTRASAATMFDSTGTLVYAPMNAIRNNTGVGAVAGTPGTLPTNWSGATTVSGLTREVVGIGTENGIQYIDVKYSGTTSAALSNSSLISFEPANQVAASLGQTWTHAVYLRVAAGSMSGITDFRVRISETDGTTVLSNGTTSVTPTIAALATQRYSHTRTTVSAGVTHVQAVLAITAPISTAIDITLRIGLPQLELGSVARTAIATSGTAYQGPRFDYDPVTLAARGMLIEEQRTNLLLQSENFATTWTTLSSPTITTNTTVAPDGTTTADTITATVTSSYVAQIITFTGDGTKAYSFFIKAGTSGNTRVFLRDTTASASRGQVDIVWTGGVPSPTVTNGSLQSLQACPNGWYRVSVIADSVVAANTNQFRIQPDNVSGTGSIIIWGFQAENGAFSTSYIPTTTAAATRAADVASVNTLAPWFNASEGTLYSEATFTNTVSFNTVAAFNDNTSSNAMRTLQWNDGTDRIFTVTTSGTPQASFSTSTGQVGTAKFAGAYKLNDMNASKNGSIGTTDTSATVPAVTTLWLGITGPTSFLLNGHIRRIGYYKRRLSNAQLQAITQ